MKSTETREVDAAAVRQQLERILASVAFCRNERLSQFLRFIVEHSLAGEHGHLKESVIAVDVFGRRADYDPKLDSIVRTEAGRLRTRLADYYSGDGVRDDVIIEVPKGGYAPLFHGRTTKPEQSRPRSRQFTFLVLGAATLLVLSSIGVWWRQSQRSEASTIAVLPLENLGHDPANDYFADGLTDEIINNLSVIDGLVVRSRTSSFALKGTPHTVREAGKQLQADYILEGSVLRAADKLRVNAQLVRVRDDFALWSGTFDRQAADIFAIQDEISRHIVNNLRLKLGSGQRRYNTNLEAYDLYLQAQQLLNRGERHGITSAAAMFEQVLEKDPSFAPAYAGLAQVSALRSDASSDRPFSEGNAKMQEYVDKALQLDPLLPDAWVFRGQILARNYQWAESEKAFRRSIELNPNLADAHENYGANLLFKIGKHQEGIQEVRKAVDLDPLSVLPPLTLAYLLINDGRPDESLQTIARLHNITQNALVTQYHGRALLQKERSSEAIAYFRDEGSKGFLGLAFAAAGKRAEAEALRESAKFPNHLALICAGLGDRDCVFEALNRMADIKDPRIHLYIVYPELALIRGDPRLDALKKKIGL